MTQEARKPKAWLRAAARCKSGWVTPLDRSGHLWVSCRSNESLPNAATVANLRSQSLDWNNSG